jgi:hypothetical protein
MVRGRVFASLFVLASLAINFSAFGGCKRTAETFFFFGAILRKEQDLEALEKPPLGRQDAEQIERLKRELARMRLDFEEMNKKTNGADHIQTPKRWGAHGDPELLREMNRQRHNEN